VTTLRFATWNLLHGMALPQGVIQPSDLRAGAKMLDADILAVQEADAFQPRSGNSDQVTEIADALDAPWYRMLPTMVGKAEEAWRPADGLHDSRASQTPCYGIGLISRFEVLRWSFRLFRPSRLGAPLLIPGVGMRYVADEQRGALAAEIVGPEGTFTVISTHLSFVPSSSTRQLRSIAATTAEFAGPRVLLGDLNLHGTVPARVSRWTSLAQRPTYPSWKPRVQWDHMLSNSISKHQVESARSHRLPVSDHCALTVDVTL
jgi:endonuclease/exonuclease/phosphatase family metal-dependent hydrolase